MCAISIARVQPLYGPVAGGTRVTITGQNVNVSDVSTVYIGPYSLLPHSIRLFIISFWCLLKDGMQHMNWNELNWSEIEFCSPTNRSAIQFSWVRAPRTALSLVHITWTEVNLLNLYLPTVRLNIISSPSPTHSFIPGLKPSFSANPSHCSPSFFFGIHYINSSDCLGLLLFLSIYAFYF